MKRQPAVRCCGLSASYAAVCTNDSSSWRSTAVLESRLTRSKLDSTSKKKLAKCLATLADRVLEGAHVRVDRVDHVQECLLRDPVRRGVGHELARERWSMRVYSAALPLIDNLCPHAAPHVRSKRDRDEGARGEDMGWLGPLGPPALACWNDAHSCLVQVPDAIL